MRIVRCLFRSAMVQNKVYRDLQTLKINKFQMADLLQIQIVVAATNPIPTVDVSHQITRKDLNTKCHTLKIRTTVDGAKINVNKRVINMQV